MHCKTGRKVAKQDEKVSKQDEKVSKQDEKTAVILQLHWFRKW